MTDRMPVSALSQLAWFKSSYSSGEGGQCLEVADLTDTVCVRDSKTLDGPIVAVSHNAWAGLIQLAVTDRTV
ncbi:DUF397 domain-containing protein [Streptomyces triticagri]|uniref:DUF397 domain-containing protein n=1 Tax=Streptomyces triticagri TaxID=2293568 RepID=A0A372MAA3_9ACTN|nr:DUF397 domain-containing protein [Streptomyces triticagri]RFU87520.1 DUF397 domain-containing protein [Streptomyces triticagri]